MSKLTFASVAMLCLLLTSCVKEEIEIGSDQDVRIESRSADNISVDFLTATGQNISMTCTRVELSYVNAFYAELVLEFEDHSSYSDAVQGLAITASEGYELDVLADENNAFSVSDLDLSLCSNELCYSNLEGSVTGTALEFIVEDSLEGF